jgi:tRNA pseudouridine38-40 synthase
LNHRYFIKLAFDGSVFHGWQSQHNAQSVQSVLNEALTVILKEPVTLTGAGRTDAGVHASEFYAHFSVQACYPVHEIRDLVYHLNGYLPDDIAIMDILPVRKDAHARFSATSRTYQYHITRRKDPFQKLFSYYYPGPLDVELMNKGALILKQNLDFTSFAKLPSETKTNICHVESAGWETKGHSLVFTITADRFLRNMVRAIVGTLIELGRGKITLEDLHRIIEEKNRSSAGYSVPASGLFLTEVKYPADLFLTVTAYH